MATITTLISQTILRRSIKQGVKTLTIAYKFNSFKETDKTGHDETSNLFISTCPMRSIGKYLRGVCLHHA